MINDRLISIDKIQLSLTNPRCIPVDNEKDAIIEILQDQGGDTTKNKLLVLAKSIKENGLNPAELLIVKPDKDIFIVMEGNRRIAAIKCMNDPTLIPKEFSRLRDAFCKIKNSGIYEAKCYITSDDDEINRLVSERHIGQSAGAGIIPWNSEQRSRFDEKVSGKKDKTIRLIDYLISIFGIDSQEAIWLNKSCKTNLSRLFSTPYVREKLGFEVRDYEYVPQNPNLKALSLMLQHLSFSSVAQIYFANDRINFIDKVFKELGETPCSNLPSLWPAAHDYNANFELSEFNAGTAKDPKDSSAPSTSRPKGHSRNRATVAPREGSPLSTAGKPNIDRIHCELKALEAHTYPMACSLLFRSLIVLSCEAFLEPRIDTNEFGKVRNKTSGLIQRVCDELLKAEDCAIQNNGLDYLRKFAQNNDSIPVSLSSLNAVAHGEGGWPDGESLILLWDKIYKPLSEMLRLS